MVVENNHHKHFSNNKSLKHRSFGVKEQSLIVPLAMLFFLNTVEYYV
jgi:hypothetical protein